MKAIVIEGGGSYGAYSAGRITAANQDYDIAIGSSTGSMIAPFALLKDYETLGRCYTSVSNKDIYEKYPFWSGGIPNVFTGLYRYLRGKRGLTNSNPLRQLIKDNFTRNHYDRIINSDKQLFITVCELNNQDDAAQYVSIRDHTYEDFCELLWASTLIPGVFETLVTEKILEDGSVVQVELADGGTVENVGLSKAVELGAKNIDVYLHNFRKKGYKPVSNNWVHVLIRAVILQRQEVLYGDLQKIIKANPTLIINTKFPKEPIIGAGRMEFDPDIMSKWYNLGYSHA